MSKETDQALVLLSTVAGCAEALRQTNSFARVDIRQSVSDTYDRCCDAVVKWPGFSNKQWIKTRREQFNEFVFGTDDNGFQSAAIVKMCARIVADLDDKFDFGDKGALVAPIASPVAKVDIFCDPDGANFPAYERADYLLDELYRLIEWRG